MTIERTTQQSVVDRTALQLSNSMRLLQESQDRLTSGKAIARISDDPAGAGAAVSLRASIGRANQFQRNIDDGAARLAESDRALQSIVERMTRVKELAVQANNGATTAEDRAAIAAELSQIKSSVIALANSSYLGQPLFGGTGGTGVAYDASGNYVGDATTVERNVAPGVRVAINISGTAVFQTGGTSLFDSLQSLIDNVSSSPSNIGTTATELDGHLATLQAGLAEVGGRVNRLDALKTHTDESIASMQKDLSSIEDVDLEKAILEAKTREVAYQAALNATARVIQPSLADFLK
ncbi:MAG: flagellar hook-associated protein FlgL [Acidimicrobiia bacterium]